MKKIIRNLILPCFFSVVIFGVFVCGFYLGVEQGITEGMLKTSPVKDMDFSLFWETYHTLEEKFVDPDKMHDNSKLIYGAISGMVSSLDDPYTIFLDPKESKRFLDDVSGSFEGVGMEIGIRETQLQVIAPLENTPAQKAGLRAGDYIVKIEDVYTQDITIDEAVDLIRGPKNTEVVLTIFRKAWDKTKEFTITRNVIEIPSLKLEFIENDIAHLRLYHFSQKANYDFKEVAIEIINSDAQKIILDLRNNPGGYLQIAQDIAGWFLEKGQVVTIEDFGQEKESKEYLAKGNSKLIHYPVVVLINQGSASGSEILAGALRDNRDIKIIGEQSYGKGSVQELKKLSDGSSLKVTIAKWLTPNGDFITDIGLAPDIEIEITDEDYENEKDPQLEKAIEVITEM
jgi:carboxyl-terminal processing protease